VQLSRMATLPKEAAEAEAASSMSWKGRGQGVGGEVAMVVMERWMGVGVFVSRKRGAGCREWERQKGACGILVEEE
jgi:hypothetical protein